MAHVPKGGGRSRHSHRSGGRTTHGVSGYLPSIQASEEVHQQTAIDAVFTEQNIQPGAINTQQLRDDSFTLSKFTQDIRPVGIVAVLPTLPDEEYPVGATVVYTVDGKLYRNVADVWEKAVDGVDIEADSITAGAIAAGAIGVSELAAGAVTAEKIAVGQITSRNHIPDPSFEAGNTWVTGSRTLATKLSGAYSGWLTTGQPYVVSSTFNVVGGHRYLASIWFRGDNVNTAARLMGLRVRWMDNAGAQIGGDTEVGSGPLAYGLTEAWFQMRGFVDAPATAVTAFVFGYHNNESDLAHNSYWDDAEFYDAAEDVSHAGGNVIIDETGVHIHNGYLSIEDEFGKSTMGASGFAGSWNDFVRLGLYNGNFLDGTPGSVPSGRTATVPYWNFAFTSGGSATLLSSGGLECNFTGTSSVVAFSSDAVPVRPSQAYSVPMTVLCEQVGGGLLSSLAHINWYDETGAFISASDLIGHDIDGDHAAGPFNAGAVVSPDDARFAVVAFDVECNVYVAGTKFTLLSVGLIEIFSEDLDAFPVAPYDGQRVYSTVFEMWFRWNGAAWLSENLFPVHIGERDVLANTTGISATTAATHRTKIPKYEGSLGIYIERVEYNFFINGGTALGISHNWQIETARAAANNTLTAIDTTTISSGSSSVWRRTDINLGYMIDATDDAYMFVVSMQKAGTPGNFITDGPTLWCRWMW